MAEVSTRAGHTAVSFAINHAGWLGSYQGWVYRVIGYCEKIASVTIEFVHDEPDVVTWSAEGLMEDDVLVTPLRKVDSPLRYVWPHECTDLVAP